ncbi:MAG: TIGR00645 family protein [Neisseriaceae bacterium]|jgi:uncharacterized protein (TIGR00645 family)|nr:MAG: TIGR00645 family protein [Neisseriaceae bacterium]
MNRTEKTFANLILFSKWFQLPLYLGLILGGCLYTYRYLVELVHLTMHVNTISESELMMGILSLVDIVMVANLLIMVIIGGYSTFVNKLDLKNEKDRPDWLDHISAGTLKIKLSTALVGISGIHLLQSFINLSQTSSQQIVLQIAIHITFLVSSIGLAFTEYIMNKSH